MTTWEGDQTVVHRSSKPAFLRPSLAVTDRLRSSSRLILVIVMLLIPGAVATWSFAAVMDEQTSFAGHERVGVDVLKPVLDEMVQVLAGQTPDLAALTALAGDHPELRLDDAVQGLRDGGADPIAQIDALTQLVTAIGNYSNLILDPDLDSFYVMDAQVVQLPRMAQVAVHAAHPGTGGSLSSRIADQAVLAGTLQSAADTIEADATTAAANSSLSGLDQKLAAVPTLAEAGRVLAGKLSGGLARPGAVSDQDFTAAVTAAVVPLTTVLEELLDARIERLEARRDRVLVLALIFFVIGVWLAVGVWWRTQHDVRQTVAGVMAITTGDRQRHPLPSGRDEMGDIGRALMVAREQLGSSAEELRSAHAAQAAQAQDTFLRQREAEKQSRERAKEVVAQTSATVVVELQSVVRDVEAVRTTAGTIDGRVAGAHQITRDVVARAEQANRVVMALGESLNKVAGMAHLIAGVADQTKLLALNANIEAARAGEAGRGFSVVAAEVKNLAIATATSTEQITSIISRIEMDAVEMHGAIGGVAASIEGVDEATSGLAGVAEEQLALVERLDASLNETIQRLNGMERMDEVLERRGRERVPVSSPLRITYRGQTRTSVPIDLSETGLGCVPPDGPALSIGDRVEVALEVMGRPMQFKAQVVRVNGGENPLLGLQFTDLTAEERDYLIRVVEDRLQPVRR
ncbi:methyl-accepting chemotaxis protein [Kineosporia sp. NBRC 101731]|uniref:methyl-accepting chemotaxis protein n=1 Tax=Kineosporia sp. NBRC 101731 TaxID=3032199 RepID=UPI0024A0B249|nr:methyl-accepting chemotaxis protein [Kineosporia sp. NBRC 101731]GLY27890.1 methyl-accepting chemotaxis protein [Kineosporia sp. NBRC 101731]